MKLLLTLCLSLFFHELVLSLPMRPTHGAGPPGPPSPNPNSPEMIRGKPSEMRAEPETNKTIDQVIMESYGGKDDMRPEQLTDGGDKKLAELDMLLTKEQYESLYGTERPMNDAMPGLSAAMNEELNPNKPEMILGKPSEMREEPQTNLTIDQVIMMALGGKSDMAPENLEDNGSMKLAELDMLLTQEQFLALYGSETGRVKRKAVKDTVYRWTDKTMPYEFYPRHFSDYDIRMINFAMDEWQTRTCFKFRPATSSDVNKVSFENGYGCNSQLGMVGRTQVLNLQSPGCRWRGLYLHEIGHALGLVHEHQLPKRDDFIDILWHNVEPSFKIWFNTYKENNINTYGVPYDLNSVMHYGTTAFSKDGQSQTIRAKDRSKDYQLGNVYKKELSFSDVKIVNEMYGCSDHCPKNIVCTGAGYIDKHCKCICPEGSTCGSGSGSGNGTDTCVDSHKTYYCQYWAEEGECEKSADWMRDKCKRSCKFCKSEETPECKDIHTSVRACKFWADSGECEKNPNWMIPNCRKSCGRCKSVGVTTSAPVITTETQQTTTSGSAVCRDLHSSSSDCEYWADIGECTANPDWMIPNCRKSCGKCTSQTNQPITTTTPATTTTTAPTTTTTATTTQSPEECKNLHQDTYCNYWRRVGECSRIPNWMKTNCKKACGFCGENSGSCTNSYHDDSTCDFWAEVGECQRIRQWMTTRCQRSCGFC